MWRQRLTPPYPQRNTRARFNAFLFNVLTPPPLGGQAPRRLEPGRKRPFPPGIPPGALPLGLRPHPMNGAPMARPITKARPCRAGGAPPPCQHGLGGPGRPQAANLSWPASGPPYGRQDPVNHARRVLRPRRPLNRARKRAVRNRSRSTTLQSWPEKEGRSLPRPAPCVEKGFTAAQGARGCVFPHLASPIPRRPRKNGL